MHQWKKSALQLYSHVSVSIKYIHGWEHMVVHTDHRPLVSIFNKPIYNAPKRLQRMLL